MFETFAFDSNGIKQTNNNYKLKYISWDLNLKKQ